MHRALTPHIDVYFHISVTQHFVGSGKLNVCSRYINCRVPVVAHITEQFVDGKKHDFSRKYAATNSIVYHHNFHHLSPIFFLLYR